MSAMKIGIVGLDTSHCKAFTEIMNNGSNPYHVTGGHIIYAYPGGTDAFSLSRDRVTGFTKELSEDYEVTIVDSIPELVTQVDAVLLESVDGRQHLEQFRQLAVGKPVFIDKPLATTMSEAIAIMQISSATKTPLMSCSSLRYATGMKELVPPDALVKACEAFGPAPLLDDYPGLFWYGIHSAEVLFSYMGEGCLNVQLVEKPDLDIVVGEWEGGRTGILHGTRFPSRDFGCVVHTNVGTHLGLAQSNPPYYASMLKEVMTFFQTGLSPIPVGQTLEIIAFLEAADLSRKRKGETVSLHL